MVNKKISEEAYRALIKISKKKKHDELNKHLIKSEILSIQSNTNSKLSLQYFLIKTIIGQQLSIKAASSIWKKVYKIINSKDKNINMEILREAGLSRSKADYVYGVLQNKEIRSLTKTKLKKLSDDDLASFFLNIKGIGPWTLNIIKVFFLEDADVFLEGDLGIQKASFSFFGIKNYSAGDYSPYRSYLCLYLWSSLKN